MSQLLHQIRQYAWHTPDQTALADLAHEYSYSELLAEVDSLSEFLLENHCQLLAIRLSNQPAWLLLQLAAMQAEIPVVPIPDFFSQEQIQHLLETTRPDLIVAASGSGTLDGYLCLSHSPVPGLQIQRAEQISDIAALPTGTALITFTSGSTGTPKGVCIGRDLIDQVCESLAQLTQPLAISRHHCVLPLAVMLENIAGALLPLYVGKTVVLLRPEDTGLGGSSLQDPEQFLRFLCTARPESLILIPELLKLLLAGQARGLDLSSLKYVAVGGARVPTALLKQALHTGLPVYEGYGLSECGSVISLNTPAASRPGSVGLPLPHCRVSFAGDGEILVHGPRMLGYLGQPANRETVTATGDIGYQDEAGYLYISGRKKSVQINSFGRNFSPEWIESELNGLPGILRAAVWGDASPSITAFIQPLPGLTQTQIEQQVEQLNQSLPDYARIRECCLMRPDEIVQGQLLTANGRIRRQKIYQFYAARLTPELQLSATC